MRLSEMGGKEIVNLHDGSRLGLLNHAELGLNPDSGKIEALIIPQRGNILSGMGEPICLTIPWDRVRKVGDEIVAVDMDLSPAGAKKRGLLGF